ncbi:hypothetical protein [Mobiluncus curtisii]|uniref:Uncharacterized protein n=1 Tax=Mobiluncus curtisii ATCC 51333 TaxID=887326 RepID=E6M0Z5_9ACTO|nr:hypothetical protein [Mobiluncus curtisii]EFU79625.1 hypothetical protein HMPREF0388_1728 [Mobiluncus curtisii ATCC 51333]
MKSLDYKPPVLTDPPRVVADVMKLAEAADRWVDGFIPSVEAGNQRLAGLKTRWDTLEARVVGQEQKGK